MRIAVFNVENLFDRPKVFNKDWNVGKPILNAYKELSDLFEKEIYTDDDKNSMTDLLRNLGLERSDNSQFVVLRKIRGRIVKRPRAGGVEIVAKGRKSWVGWLELKSAPTNEVATDNTGRVIRDIDADIFAVVEAEDRVGLEKFTNYVLKKVNGKPYSNIMMIDGNDQRGIDVGIMTKSDFPIGNMRTHIFDKNDEGKNIFSRDCPEYEVKTPSGDSIWELINHYKSKGYGSFTESNARRKAQAQYTADIYRNLINQGYENIAVVGDLNDTPDSDPLEPLLYGTDLEDISTHPNFSLGEYEGIGTFKGGTNSNKIDFLLLSPSLYERVTDAGIFRKGAWPGTRRPKWSVYDELQEQVHAASDHHALWADIDL